MDYHLLPTRSVVLLHVSPPLHSLPVGRPTLLVDTPVDEASPRVGLPTGVQPTVVVVLCVRGHLCGVVGGVQQRPRSRRERRWTCQTCWGRQNRGGDDGPRESGCAGGRCEARQCDVRRLPCCGALSEELCLGISRPWRRSTNGRCLRS